MNILKSLTVCSSAQLLVLTEVVWTQPEKSSSQPFSVLVHINVSLKEEAGWKAPPLLFHFHSHLLGVPSIKVDLSFFFFLMMMSRICETVM